MSLPTVEMSILFSYEKLKPIGFLTFCIRSFCKRLFETINSNRLHSPLNATISSVRVLHITAKRTESLVEGGWDRCFPFFEKLSFCFKNNKKTKTKHPFKTLFSKKFIVWLTRVGRFYFGRLLTMTLR